MFTLLTDVSDAPAKRKAGTRNSTRFRRRAKDAKTSSPAGHGAGGDRGLISQSVVD
jgi:hypothetical protein